MHTTTVLSAEVYIKMLSFNFLNFAFIISLFSFTSAGVSEFIFLLLGHLTKEKFFASSYDLSHEFKFANRLSKFSMSSLIACENFSNSFSASNSFFIFVKPKIFSSIHSL